MEELICSTTWVPVTGVPHPFHGYRKFGILRESIGDIFFDLHQGSFIDPKTGILRTTSVHRQDGLPSFT